MTAEPCLDTAACSVIAGLVPGVLETIFAQNVVFLFTVNTVFLPCANCEFKCSLIYHSFPGWFVLFVPRLRSASLPWVAGILSDIFFCKVEVLPFTCSSSSLQFLRNLSVGKLTFYWTSDFFCLLWL